MKTHERNGQRYVTIREIQLQSKRPHATVYDLVKGRKDTLRDGDLKQILIPEAEAEKILQTLSTMKRYNRGDSRIEPTVGEVREPLEKERVDVFLLQAKRALKRSGVSYAVWENGKLTVRVSTEYEVQ